MQEYIIILSVIAKNEEDAKRIVISNPQKYLNKSDVYTIDEYNDTLSDD